ncbi:MAG: T9SS type A sorting domain-containing protein [Bacteroidota bacterium]
MRIVLMVLLMSIANLMQAQSFEWRTLATGAGGWITGMDIHPSGSPVYARSDVGSAYRYNEVLQEWENIVTASNIPATDIYWNRFGGVLSIVSAPSNASRAYMAYIDAIYTSSDRGDTWEKTNFPSMDLGANDDESKLSGERLAVDPVNEDILYFGTPENGLYVTINGGLNWQSVSAIPNGILYRGIRQIVFDQTGGTTNNKTNIVYVTVDGEGVFKSDDAGTSWSNVSFSAPSPIFLDTEIDNSGNLYCVGRDENNQTFGIQKFDGTAWKQIQNNGTTYFNVAIDPFDQNRVVVLSEGFTETALTSNAGATNPDWSYPGRTLTAANIPWLSWAENNWFTVGEMTFDPVVPDKLWIADGIGVWNVNDINSVNLTWEENSKNQEHLVSNDLVIGQDGKVVTAHWDRPIFWHDDLGEYPTQHQPTNRFNSAWDMDVSPTGDNLMVAIIEDHRFCCYDDQHRNSGYSKDGGVTWTRFPSQPDALNDNSIFGNIAISAFDSENIVWLPTGNQAPYYTNDLGETWQQATLPNDQGNCCLNFNFVYKKALTADKVLPNTFYIYNWENGSIYVSSDGGATWTERTALQDYFGWNAKLSTSPNHANHLWYSHGAESDIGFTQALKRSTDGGVTWQTLNNTSEVLNHAIGVPLPDANYPTLFIQGRVNGEFGYWMSADEGLSWKNIGTYPKGIYDIANVMEGDPTIPTRVYIGFRGNGFVYGQDDIVSSTDDTQDRLSQISLHPNPTEGLFQIESKQPIDFLDLYDLSGRLLMSWQNLPNRHSINIQQLPKGMYLLKVDKVKSLKLIKG